MPRFMLFMYPNATEDEYAEGPSLEAVEEMNRYNEEVQKAGALLALDGLHPGGTRVAKGGVTDGRSARPRSSSAATGSSRPRTKRRPSSGPSASRRTSARSSRSARSMS